MAQKGKFLCTNREDILISRGANPRTGLISPFVSDEISDSSDGTDYVRVRRERKDCEPTPTAQAQVCTVPYPSRLSGLRANRGLGCPACGRLSLTGHHIYQVSPISPDSLFKIPRKPVGGQKASSRPTPKGSRGAAQILTHLKHISGSGKKSEGTPSPASLDGENASLGFYAHPSVIPEYRSTRYHQTYSPPVLYPLSNKKGYEPNYRHQQHYTLNDYIASRSSTDPLPRSKSPDLAKASRRPKVLGCPLASACENPIQFADACMATAHRIHHTSVNPVLRQRPYIRRVQASTSVHRLDAVRGMAPSASLDRKSARPLLQERDAPGHAIDMRSSPRGAPTQPSDSTHAARKAFLTLQGNEPHQTAEENPRPHYAVKQLPPLLSLNGVLLLNQSIFGNDSRIVAQNPMPRNHLQDAPVAIKAIGTNSDQRFVAHGSTRDTNETWSSVPAVALEITSLIDLSQVQTQVLQAMKQGALAAGRTPWALRILMSQHADSRTYLFAARYMMVTSLYLVILLSVLAAGFRTLELLVEIGHYIWYPFGVLLSVAGWILTL